ncbi:carboxypeptidase-like regulatory domain-containing protein [Candidatus Methylocalor cossyra]|uniref:Carboxypeptidase regulatory-like domain-containing protein n=1 Tax=Candidatus Methylocalor cossyra TaxID=3108543 RepID=A0ABP1C7Q2_9GAMM
MKTFSHFVNALFLIVASLAAPALAEEPGPPKVQVPGYGPGIAGHVIVAPYCPPGTFCPLYLRTYPGAIVLVLNEQRQTVAEAHGNESGSFIVSVPPGTYILHVQTVDYPRCPEVQAVVEGEDFTLTNLRCVEGGAGGSTTPKTPG